MSFLEIYNEKVYDLLVVKEQDLQIREDQERNIFIPNLAQVSFYFLFFIFYFLFFIFYFLFFIFYFYIFFIF